MLGTELVMVDVVEGSILLLAPGVESGDAIQGGLSDFKQKEAWRHRKKDQECTFASLVHKQRGSRSSHKSHVVSRGRDHVGSLKTIINISLSVNSLSGRHGENSTDGEMKKIQCNGD